MWILAERGDQALSCDGHDMLADVARAAAGGPPLVVVTGLIKDGRTYAFDKRAVVHADGHMTGSLGGGAIDSGAADAAVSQLDKGPARLIVPDERHELLIEPVTGRPGLVIAGGGHVARAIARQARLLDFDVTVIEDRPEFANPERFDGATVLAGDVAKSIESLRYGGAGLSRRGHARPQDGRRLRAGRRQNERPLHRPAGQPAQDRADCRALARTRDCGRSNRGDSRARRARSGRPHACGNRPRDLAEITQHRYGGTGQATDDRYVRIRLLAHRRRPSPPRSPDT